MKDHDGIDFSALDIDPEEWQAFTAATLGRTDRVLEARALRAEPVRLLASWSRPILRAAAVLLAVLVPVEFALERRETSKEQIDTLVQVSSEAARGVRQPTPAELLRVVGGEWLP